MTQEEEEAVTFHEAAHFAVATALGINACPTVLAESQRYPQANGSMVAGECRLDNIAKPSAFQLAVICWAGVVLEGLLKINHTLSIPFPLTRRTARDWCSAAMANFDCLSFGDQRGIAEYKPHWVSFKAAYRIVTKNKRRILRLARLMLAERQKQMNELTVNTSATEQSAILFRLKKVEELLQWLPAEHVDRPALEAAREHLRQGRFVPQPNGENQ